MYKKLLFFITLVVTSSSASEEGHILHYISADGSMSSYTEVFSTYRINCFKFIKGPLVGEKPRYITQYNDATYCPLSKEDIDGKYDDLKARFEKQQEMKKQTTQENKQ